MTAPMLDSQLVLLLEIQDLRAQLQALSEHSDDGVLEEAQFGIDVEQASEALRQKIGDLSALLSEPVRRRFQRIEKRLGRVVVPVIAGTCYGCFVSVATATAGEVDPNAELQSCENCGRFLYFLT